jgi:hypothetical protein
LPNFQVDGYILPARPSHCSPEQTNEIGSGEESIDGELSPAFRVRFYPLYFIKENVVFLNHCTVKTAIAPTQRITCIVPYWGMEMLLLAFLDEFDHIFDGHRNLLIAVDAAATIEPDILYKS